MFRRLATVSVSTEPLIKGGLANKRNLGILDEIDKLGLSRSRALYIDKDGNFQKTQNWQNEKLTEQEKSENEGEYKKFFY